MGFRPSLRVLRFRHAPSSTPSTGPRYPWFAGRLLWNDRENYKLIEPLVVILAVPLGLLFPFLVSPIPVWLTLGVITVLSFAQLGLIERYIRYRVMKRRKEYEALESGDEK